MALPLIRLVTIKIFRSTSRLEKKTEETNKLSRSILKTLESQSVFKKKSIAKRENIYRLRRNAIRRKEQEDIVEASKATSPISKIGKAITSSSQGFLGRILKAIGLTLTGWIVNNMPIIVSFSKQLGERIVKLTGTLSSFTTNTVRLLQELGGLVVIFGRALMSFNFAGAGKQINSQLEKVKGTFNRMEIDFRDALNLLTEPFKFGDDDEPAPGDDNQVPGKPGPQTPATGGSADFWLLALISLYENSNTQGAVDVAQSIYNRMGYSGRTARQEILARNQYAPVGEYGKTADWNKVVNRETAIAHIKKFGGNGASPNGLDRVANALLNKSMQQSAAKFVGNRPDFRSKGFEQQYDDMTNDATRHGQTFGFNRGSAYLGKSTTAAPVPDMSATTGVSGPQPLGQLGTRPFAVGDVLTQSLGKGVSYIEVTDVKGSRGGKHGGIDIAAPSGTWIALRVDCEWVGYKADFPNGPGTGYGHVLDVWVPSLNVQLRFAHLASKPQTFAKIPAGTSFAQVGSTGKSSGPHLHFEYTATYNSTTYGSDGDPSPYVPYLLFTNNPNSSSFAVPGKGNTVAQVSSTGRSTAISSGITPERQGKTLVVAAPQSIQQSPMMTGGSSGESSIVIAGSGLNSLIKQRILMELAYT